MLVLGREIGETIIITLPDGQRITVTCCAARVGKCRIGIDADPAFTIHRGEIQETIDAELLNADDPNHPDFGRDYA